MSDKARAFDQSSLSPLQCGPAPLHPQLASLSGSHSELTTPNSAPLLLPRSSCLLYLDALLSPIFIAICFISFYSSFKTQLSSSSEKPHLTISVGLGALSSRIPKKPHANLSLHLPHGFRDTYLCVSLLMAFHSLRVGVHLCVP